MRVVRGAEGDPDHSPESGYRYDGLFFIDRYWSQTGRSGHMIWRFRLVEESRGLPTALHTGEGGDIPDRVETTVQRIVRNTVIAQRVKELHGHRCQICGTVVTTPGGKYAEVAHIRPLGRPHDGPDIASNVLCLCPNDHVRFDRGAITIGDDGLIRSADGATQGELRSVAGHEIDPEFLAYQRGLFGSQKGEGDGDV